MRSQEQSLMVIVCNIFIQFDPDFILLIMAASFASRLSNLREKKINQNDQEGQFKLTLPPDPSQKSTYEPSSTFNNTRGSFRLLKGRIERGQSSEKQQLISNNVMQDSKGMSALQKISLPQENKQSLKLVLNDDPFVEQKKPISEPPKIPIQKRILIAKQPPKQQVKKQEAPPPKKEEVKKVEVKVEPAQQKIEKKQQQKIIAHEQKPIREQQFEESLPPESENDLVLCPEGCGRKFNRKALEKHAKACKLVFMSKRKEFNSEAKRITSKEQANLVKQNKLEEKKKMGMTKGKGFDKTKTGQNWKANSEDFRAAIRAIKKEQKEQDEGEPNIDENLQDKKVVNVMCEYCEKQFNEVFIEKHQENCVRKKEKEREKEKKKTGKK